MYGSDKLSNIMILLIFEIQIQIKTCIIKWEEKIKWKKSWWVGDIIVSPKFWDKLVNHFI